MSADIENESYSLVQTLEPVSANIFDYIKLGRNLYSKFANMFADKKEGNVQIFTVKAAKGMEFRQVYVVDRDMSMNEKYVAYTRALVRLTVVHSMPIGTKRSNTLVVQGEENGEDM